MQCYRKTTFRSAIASIRRGVGGDPQPREPAKPSKGYNKSEYKKKFRPFSHYVYEASKGTFTKRRAAKGADQGADKGARGADEPEGALVAAGATTTRDRGDNALQAAGLQSLGMKNADSWYREVLDLRKRAGEYKVRTTQPLQPVLSSTSVHCLTGLPVIPASSAARHSRWGFTRGSFFSRHAEL